MRIFKAYYGWDYFSSYHSSLILFTSIMFSVLFWLIAWVVLVYAYCVKLNTSITGCMSVDLVQ